MANYLSDPNVVNALSEAGIDGNNPNYLRTPVAMAQSALTPASAEAFYAGPNALGYSDARVAGKTMNVPWDAVPRFEVSDNKADWTGWETPIVPQPKGGMTIYRLDEILDHPELFKQYPEAKDLKVHIYDMPEGSLGGFSKEGGIHLSTASSKAKDGGMGTLLHEIQHWIQHREGMNVDNPLSEAGDGDFTVYWNSPPEIEARDVTARANLTDEQRLAKKPYTSERIKPDVMVRRR